MAKKTKRKVLTGEKLFVIADALSDRGRLKAAHARFLEGAMKGHVACQNNVGYTFDVGKGVRRNREQAMKWYKRAYRNGYAPAASNIGTIYRDERDPKRAERWFLKSLKMGDDSSALELVKLVAEKEPQRAIKLLKLVIRSKWVSVADEEEARKLLKKMQR